MFETSHKDYVKFALPKGKIIEPTSNMLNQIGFGFRDYTKETRLYRLQSNYSEINILAKIFQEKDIPIQVAVGNYDIGICGKDWIEELLAKYPESPIVELINLEYDSAYLFLCTSKYTKIYAESNKFFSENIKWRLVSEYPNLAENTAQKLRLKRYKIFPVWGDAEVYPPEDADLIIIKRINEAEVIKDKLLPIKKLFKSTAVLIANKNSWEEKKNLSNIISKFTGEIISKNKHWSINRADTIKYKDKAPVKTKATDIRLALPDGHQLVPTSKFIEKCGIKLLGYTEKELNYRPISNIQWLKLKVIRPQDMPIHVANNHFDLAITGKDWLSDHIYQFPSSPIRKLMDFNFGKVKIVAVISKELNIKNINELKLLIKSGHLIPLRVATEYVNIADRYLQKNHISTYKIIPTWGATEALLPEDADLLIENTQTGKTLEAHNLKVIDVLFQSTACLIVNRNSMKNERKKGHIYNLLKIFQKG